MGSISLEVVEQPNEVMMRTIPDPPAPSPPDTWGSTFFEPQSEQGGDRPAQPSAKKISSSNNNSNRSSSRDEEKYDEAPEKKLTLFALRLAILEKAASGIGTLGFIWATVVLLGGFAIALEKKDFWFITVILLIEGTRIFSRSHELEWQHQATWSITHAGRYSFRAIKSSSRFVINIFNLTYNPFAAIHRRRRRHTTNRIDRAIIDDTSNDASNDATVTAARRSWNTHDVPLLPYVGWFFLSRHISKLLYWLQLLSATACISLSLIRLIDQNYGTPTDPKDHKERRNLKSALNIFYSLALGEALLFLAEKAYWEWTLIFRRLLDQVAEDADLGPTHMLSIKRFFYDSYSKCIAGTIFDGLKMDLVSFAEDLLHSTSHDEQLLGARILHKLATSRRFADETLRKIGTSARTVEKLVDMLDWKNPAEEKVRKSAAVVVAKLAGKRQNALRLAGVAGSMESVSALLCTECGNDGCYEYSGFNLMGLLILKRLASDHDNCGKIGSTRGLLAKIIDFTGDGERWCRREGGGATEAEVKAVKRALQVVKKLASTTGHTGKILRKEIAEIVFMVKNIRDILQYAEDYVMLQRLGIEILTSLAMDEEARERIGSTGRMIKELVRIFFGEGATEEENVVKVEAGEALAMLALENKRNCRRILKEKDASERFVHALGDPVLRLCSFRVLSNLCAYVGSEHLSHMKAVATAIPAVLNAIMIEEMKLLEVSLGLATQLFRFISIQEFDLELAKCGIEQVQFVEKLVGILNTYNQPSIRVPRIRRFVLELAIWMMKSDAELYVELFRDLEMEKELQNISETTSELECFNVFSGSVGLSRHATTVCFLVDTALEFIAEG